MAAHALIAPAAPVRTTTESKLRDRIAELEEENRQLRLALVPPAVLPRAWRLTPTEEAVLRSLMAAGAHFATDDRLLLAMEPFSWGQQQTAKDIAVIASRLRRKLRDIGPGCEIEIRYGLGRRLSPPTLAHLRGFVEREARAQ